MVVMVTNALSANTALINQGFQNAAVYPFVLLGTVMVLVWTAQRFRYGWIPAIAVALVVTVQALSYGAGMAPVVVRAGSPKSARPRRPRSGGCWLSHRLMPR